MLVGSAGLTVGVAVAGACVGDEEVCVGVGVAVGATVGVGVGVVSLSSLLEIVNVNLCVDAPVYVAETILAPETVITHKGAHLERSIY